MIQERDKVYVQNVTDTVIIAEDYIFLPGEVKIVDGRIFSSKGLWNKFREKLISYLRDDNPGTDISRLVTFSINKYNEDEQEPTRVTVDEVDYDVKAIDIGGAIPFIVASEVIITPTPVTGVSLNKETTSINVAGTETLVATVAPAGATNKGIIWSSGNTAVATVNDAGVVTAVATGTAVITVTTADGEFTDTCVVTVTT